MNGRRKDPIGFIGHELCIQLRLSLRFARAECAAASISLVKNSTFGFFLDRFARFGVTRVQKLSDYDAIAGMQELDVNHVLRTLLSRIRICH